MAHIQWTSDLDTNIQVIDNQHRRIVDYINQLDDASKAKNRGETGQVLNDLVDYTLSHFAFEESLMEEAGYPFINGHKRVHELFVKRVSDFQQRFKMGEDISSELLTVLKSWLVNHIKSDDNDYASLVQSNLTQGGKKNTDGWITRSVKKFFR